MFECNIVADSISDQGYRLTSFQVTFPRLILAEFNKHRMLSQSAGSNRALKASRVIEAIREDPFCPKVFESEQKGMVGGEPLRPEKQTAAEWIWQAACNAALTRAEMLDKAGVHRSIVNRPMEPYQWQTMTVTGTDWSNFFALRCASDAQPQFREIAVMMQEMYYDNEPKDRASSQLHLPFISDDEIDAEALQWPEPYVDWDMWAKVAIGRVAGQSYNRKEQRPPEPDIELHDRLRASRPPHLVPFEHVARPFTSEEWQIVDTIQSAVRMLYEDRHPQTVEYLCRQVEYRGNLHGWVSRRAGIPNEHDASLLV